MRISDWSSDVCSSDLTAPFGAEELTDSFVCVFERREFDRFGREHPRLEPKLLERTLAELERTRRWMMLLGRMTAEHKVASFLLELRDRRSDDHTSEHQYLMRISYTVFCLNNNTYTRI